MARNHVVTRRGGTPSKAIEFVRTNPSSIKNYKVIVLHFGTNWLSNKYESGRYVRMANSQISKEEYEREIKKMNPPSNRKCNPIQR